MNLYNNCIIPMNFTPERVEFVIDKMREINIEAKKSMYYLDPDDEELLEQLTSYFEERYLITSLVIDKYMFHTPINANYIKVDDILSFMVRELESRISIVAYFNSDIGYLQVYFTVHGGDFELINQQIRRQFVYPTINLTFVD